MIRPSFTVERLVQLERILVTGASGLLGRPLVTILSKKHEVIPTHHAHTIQPNSLRINVDDRDMVFKTLRDFRPAVVVHAAAETNVDKCETNKELAWRINAEGTRNVAQACVRIGAKLIYISTDYVFDGNRGFYIEEDKPNPINYYGFSKLKGEEFVEQAGCHFVIARTSVLYGWHPRKLNFATWVIDSLKNGRAITVADDHYNSPTLADILAVMVLETVEKDLTGIYHMAGGARVSRYEFAVQIADVFGLDKTLVARVRMNDLKMWVAKRPRDSSLCTDKTRRETGIRPPLLGEALEMMRNSFGKPLT
jgi:dTDP-4-dehydrorhamnose reductase